MSHVACASPTRFLAQESILGAFVAWQAGTTTLFLLGSQPPYIVLKFQQCAGISEKFM